MKRVAATTQLRRPHSSMSSEDRRLLMDVLLHEDAQYREEMNSHDSRLITAGLTHLSGVVAATAWLASRLLEYGREIIGADGGPGPRSPEVLGQAMQWLVLGQLYYLIVGVPIVTTILFFIVARGWVSIHERIRLLQLVGKDVMRVAEAAQPSPKVELLRFSRGLRTTRLRRWVELPLTLYWGSMVTVLAGSALIWTAWARAAWISPLRAALWLTAALGTLLSILCLLVIVGVYLRHWQERPTAPKWQPSRDKGRISGV